jgi:acetyl esterase/lipase
MTASTTSTEATLPLPKHSLTLAYLRLRAIAALLQVPLAFLLSLSYHFRDPSLLRKYQVNRSRITIPSRQKGRSIKVDIYTPKSTTISKPYPVHINWHGSGFVMP